MRPTLVKSSFIVLAVLVAAMSWMQSWAVRSHLLHAHGDHAAHAEREHAEHDYAADEHAAHAHDHADTRPRVPHQPKHHDHDSTGCATCFELALLAGGAPLPEALPALVLSSTWVEDADIAAARCSTQRLTRSSRGPPRGADLDSFPA